MQRECPNQQSRLATVKKNAPALFRATCTWAFTKPLLGERVASRVIVLGAQLQLLTRTRTRRLSLSLILSLILSRTLALTLTPTLTLTLTLNPYPLTPP